MKSITLKALPSNRYSEDKLGGRYVHQQVARARAGFNAGHVFMVDQKDHPMDGEIVCSEDLEDYSTIRFRPTNQYKTGLIMVQTFSTYD